MSRARDNADKLNGGETIITETIETNICKEVDVNGKITGLSVRNLKDECIFSVEETGRLIQQYVPEDPGVSDRGPGVILLSDKGGIRALKGPILQITRDGGLNWHTCCGIDPDPEPEPDPIPPSTYQTISLTITKVVGRWEATSGYYNYLGFKPSYGTFDTLCAIRWGRDANRTEPKYSYSSYGFETKETPFTVSSDVTFPLGELGHQNRPITRSRFKGADLKILMDLTLVHTITKGDYEEVATYNYTDVPFEFEVDHDETNNEVQPCPYGGRNYSGINVGGCADKVYVNPPDPGTNTLVFGEEGAEGSIFLKVVGFSPTEIDAYHTNYIYEWFTKESRSNSTYLAGFFQATYPEIEID